MPMDYGSMTGNNQRNETTSEVHEKPMKVLVLGGTNFIGRTVVERFQQSKTLEITLFNRGISNPNVFPQLRTLVGDRESTRDLNQVFHEKWDVVIDCSGYYPKSVRELVNGLNRDLTKYIFISTCSVYNPDLLQVELRNEKSPLLFSSTEDESNTSSTSYGKRKAACEQIIAEAGLPFVIFRPALVFGPYDSTDRFYYWLYQMVFSDSVLLPEAGGRRFSMTYVGDLAEAIFQATVQKESNGIFNAISYPITSIKEIVESISEITEKKPALIDVPASFLHEQNVREWTDIPLWLNSDYYTYSNQKLLRIFDLDPTPLKASIAKTIAHFKTVGFHIPKAGIKNLQQQSLIQIIENDR